jgi:hypothetical protein
VDMRRDAPYCSKNSSRSWGRDISHRGEYENYGLMWCDASWVCRHVPASRKELLHASFTLKMKTPVSLEDLVPTYQITWRHILGSSNCNQTKVFAGRVLRRIFWQKGGSYRRVEETEYIMGNVIIYDSALNINYYGDQIKDDHGCRAV